ncbi:MAG: SDR family NAD(P)-dependent oxidoreductase [Candidatus Aminicenantes bacterium]|nr:SDR family NAD(P)-dependent oxidoreductase [Candidatus Aminicenantes bacterium]
MTRLGSGVPLKARSKFSKYFWEYRWSNILAMMRNNRRGPKKCPEDFKTKLVVITGATSGIGRATARAYASRGANLLCLNRNPDKSEALRREIESEFGVTCNFLTADLSRLADIHRAAERLAGLAAPIDVLIHNAGVYLNRRDVTEDGIETMFAIHHLAPFILNYTLKDKLMAQKKARIILVNSEGHRFAAWGLRLDDLNWEKRRYSGLKSYGSAKTAQLLTIIVFNERFRGTGVSINAMHPGAVKTDSGRDNGPVYRWMKRNFLDKTLKPAELSAEALVYLGVSGEVEGISGKFFNLTTLEEPAPPALDREEARKIWDKSLEWSGLR